MKKKVLTRSDIKYPILSMLFDSPEELAARADALRGLLIDDLDDDSHPRLQQLEIISEMLKPDFDKAGKRYQHTLQQVKLSELHSLLKSSDKPNDTTNLIARVKQIQKLGNELSFDLSLTSTHIDDSLSWSKTTEANLRIKLDKLDYSQEKILSKLDRKPTLDNVLPILEEFGLEAVSVVVKKAILQRNILNINDSENIEFEYPSYQASLISLFFTKKGRLANKFLQFGDIFDKLEQHNPQLETSGGRRQLKQRYYEARRNINTKVKAETHMKADFILYKNGEFSINQDLLK